MNRELESDDAASEYLEPALRRSVSRRAVMAGLAAGAASVPQYAMAEAPEPMAKTYRPAPGGMDYAATDSPYYDPEYPAINFPFSFMSNGTPLQAFMWLAGGRETKGCIIFDPAHYGEDSLASLVPPLLNAGINVLRFNPRGLWDGKYSFVGTLEDVHAAVSHLGENGGRHVVPDARARPYGIDLSRIAVLGKSGGGGMMGWIATAENPSISTCVTISPTRLLPYPMTPDWVKQFTLLKAATAGRIDIDRELGEMSKPDYDRFDMFKAAPKLVDKNVLLVGDNRAEYLHATHWPLVKSMERAGAKHFSQALFQCDASYLNARIALARLVVSWLKSQCGY